MNSVYKYSRKVLNSPLGVILFLVSLAAFYTPREVSIMPVVVQYITPVRYVCGALLIIAFFLIYISGGRLFRDNWFLLPSAAFIAILIYSTYINNADMETALGGRGLAAVFLVLLVAVFFKVNMKKYLAISFFVLLAFNIANTYCVFHYWGVGMWEVWGVSRNKYFVLVGNYNGGVEYVLPMAVCGSAYAHRYGKWLEIFNYPAMIMSLIMAIKCNSDTQIIVFSVILAGMLLGDIAFASKGFAKVLKNVFNPVVMVAVNLVAWFSIVWLDITGWLEKIGIDPDFHGRRHIWDMAIEWIKAKPVWGNGLETEAVKSSKIVGYAHCHSWFLDIVYMTGIVGSIAAFIMLIVVIVAIFRLKNNRLSYIMSGMLFALCLTNLFETYTVTFFVFTLAMIYYIAKNGSESPAVRKRK